MSLKILWRYKWGKFAKLYIVSKLSPHGMNSKQLKPLIISKYKRAPKSMRSLSNDVLIAMVPSLLHPNGGN
jgi:hypothetical protein